MPRAGKSRSGSQDSANYLVLVWLNLSAHVCHPVPGVNDIK